MSRRVPAQYPPGPWPAEMRAPKAAAFLDYETSADLIAAVKRGEAPRPTAKRGPKHEPVWAKAACESWIAQRHQIALMQDGADTEDIASLI